MGIQGIAAGADQIADGTNPNQLASVDSAGNFGEINKAIDAAGVTRTMRVGADGRTEISSADILVAQLIEMRISNYYLWAIASGSQATDDPDTLRADADLSGLARTLA